MLYTGTGGFDYIMQNNLVIAPICTKDGKHEPVEMGLNRNAKNGGNASTKTPLKVLSAWVWQN